MNYQILIPFILYFVVIVLIGVYSTRFSLVAFQNFSLADEVWDGWLWLFPQ